MLRSWYLRAGATPIPSWDKPVTHNRCLRVGVLSASGHGQRNVVQGWEVATDPAMRSSQARIPACLSITFNFMLYKY